MRRIKLARINPETVVREIGDFIVKETVEEGRIGGVIGLSGGVDSTTSAALAKKAFDRYNSGNPEVPLELVGYLLPSKLNQKADEDDGRKVAERLGIRYELINIEPLVEAKSRVQPRVMASQFNKGNQISELRAGVLHGQAALENKILIGTGNKDEDFGVGYYTLFGDGAVRVSPIGLLPKRLVRQMAEYLGFSDLAQRVSSPGLEPGQTAFKDLGYQYEKVVELYGNGIEQGFTSEELMEHPQLISEAEINIAEYKEAFGRSKFNSVGELLRDIQRRNNSARGKARVLSPPMAKITLEYE
ncbi:MAG: NAD(+) synthase [archaeon]|nr:NAD(+) synthase [archaeon]